MISTIRSWVARAVLHPFGELGAASLVLAARRGLRFPLLTVVNYHRVAEPAEAAEVDEGVLDATPTSLAGQLDVLQRHMSPITLPDLEAALEGKPLPPNPFLLTFDDGYRECHDRVLPLLLERGLRAVFFVPTDFVERRRVFWWDRIAWILKHATHDTLALDVPIQMRVDARSRGAAFSQIMEIFWRTPGLDVEQFASALASAAGAPWNATVERQLADRLVMTWDQVRALARAGMTIGSHTRTHRVLQSVPAGELAAELEGSRADLERVLDRPVTSLAMPVGFSIADHPELRSAVLRAGYRTAFSYNTGAQSLRNLDPLDIRRIGMQPAYDRATFRAVLAVPRLLGAAFARAASQRPASPPSPPRDGRRSSRPVPAVVLGDLSLVRPVAAAAINVHLGLTDPADVTRHSRLLAAKHPLPAPRDPAFAEALLQLGARLHRQYGSRVPLYYGTDAQLDALYRRRAELAVHYLFLLNEPEVAWALHDKSLFHRLCEEAEVVVPLTVGPDQDLRAALDGVVGPVLVKPRTKVAWTHLHDDLLPSSAKARVYPDAKALLADAAVARHRRDIIIQELVPGTIDDLVSFHGFADERGTVLACFSGRKIRTFPMQAGESACIEIIDDGEVERTGRDIARRLGLRGPFKIDLIRDPRDGRLLTMEVNARFNLWHDLGAARGVNLPGIAYEYLVNGARPAAERPHSAPARWVSGYRELKAWRELAKEKPLTGLWQWARSVFTPHTRHEVFAWSDPLPFAVWAFRFLFGRRARS